MSSKAITTLLADKSQDIYDATLPDMIKVDHVTMDFNSANQQLNSLKEYFIAAAKRELLFKQFRALDDVSLTVQKGDVFGILGTNGSGKSTLLKIVSGVLEPTSGSVSIHGNIAPLIEMGAGFDYELTARENIYLNGALLGYPKEFISQHFDAIVDFAEIRDFLDMPLKNYSSGMVSRIAFAIATVIVPEILIVDEVLAVGDFMFRQKCEKRIQSLIHDCGTTVLIVSHSSEQIERLCNKAIWIEKGHVRMIGQAREVSQTYQALGGHSGSPDDERAIFELVSSPIPYDPGMIETIAGQDRYSTNAVVIGKSQGMSPKDSVVVGPGQDPASYLTALALAGATNSHCLMTLPERLPESTLTTLANIAPSKLYYLEPANADSQVISSIRAAVPRECEIETFSFKDLDSAAIALYDLRQKQPRTSNGTTAFISNGECGSASATFGQLIHSGYPYFVLTQESTVDRILELATANHIEEFVLLGDEDSPYFADFGTKAKGLGISTSCIDDNRDDASNGTAVAWLKEQLGTCEKTDESIYFSSQDGIIDALSVAPLVSEDNGLLLTINHNDMTSMGRAIEAVRQSAQTLQRIVFLGSNVCFNGIDKEMLAKAAALGKNATSDQI